MDATAYILAGTPEGESAVAEKAAIQLYNGSISFTHIILSVGEYVTGNDMVQQAKAIEYIAAILAKLNASFLTRQNVSLMVKYLLAHLETNQAPGLKQSAVGLQALAGMARFDTNDAIEISRKIFSTHDHFNEQAASTRLEVYKLLDLLMDKHRAALEETGGDFIDGMISLAALEKDPRNLMLYFSMMLVILTEWDIQAHAQDLWDAVSKYFPISFRPRPDDPTGITPDDLKLRLRLCIAATSQFAPFAFPILIEKLDDQVTANVKKDVMQTMTACVRSYGLQAAATWSSQLFDALKFEILNATEGVLADEASTTLQAIAARLSYGLTMQTLDGTPLFRYIEGIIDECLKHVNERQQRYVGKLPQIIRKVAAGSSFAFYLVVKQLFPSLHTAIQDPTKDIHKKRELLELVNAILDARLTLAQSQESSDFPYLSSLDSVSKRSSPDDAASLGLHFFRDEAFELFALALTNSPSQEISIRITGVRGLLRLVKMPLFLTEPEIGMIVQHLDELVLQREDLGDTLREEVILSLQEVENLYPQAIQDITFPALLGTLPRVFADKNDVKKHVPVLEALAKIGSGDHLFPVFIRRLRNKLKDVIHSGVSQDYAHTILAALLYGIGQRESIYRDKGYPTGHKDHIRRRDIELYRSLVECLHRTITALAEFPDDGLGPFLGKAYVGLRPLTTAQGEVFADDYFIELVGKISMVTIRSMSLEDQSWAASQVFTLFSYTDSDSHGAAVLGDKQTNLAGPAIHDRGTLTLSMYILAGLRRENELGFSPQEICNSLIRCYLESAAPIQSKQRIQDSVEGLVALLINKWDAIMAVPGTLDITLPQDIVRELVGRLDSMLECPAGTALRMVVIFTMAANLRGDPTANELLNMLMSELGNSRRGWGLAKDFQYLLAPSEILSKENFAITRGLHKQRLFSICVPRIVDLFRACTDPELKRNYLVALSGILKDTPAEIVLPEIESLLPIILQSMEIFGASVKGASIDVLNTAIVESPASVEGHIRSVIKRLLDRIRNTLEYPSDAPSAIRVKALKCLGAMPGHIKDGVILPYKVEVIRELETAVNDVKRNVREQAVRCRFEWFNLVEPAEEDC